MFPLRIPGQHEQSGATVPQGIARTQRRVNADTNGLYWCVK